MDYRAIKQYPTYNAFANAYKADLQLEAIRDGYRFLICEDVRVMDIAYTYGQNFARQWIDTQLATFRMHRKVDAQACYEIDREVNELMLNLFYHDTAAVFILFAAELRAGKLGKTYGASNVNDVTEAANNFRKDLWKRKQMAKDRLAREQQHEVTTQRLKPNDCKKRGLEALAELLASDTPYPILAYLNIKHEDNLPMSEANQRAYAIGKASFEEAEDRRQRI